MLGELGMQGSDCVREETESPTKEFCGFGFVDEYERGAVFV